MSWVCTSYANYLCVETFENLKKYVNEEIDTSNWSPCDIVKVHLTHDCSEDPEIFIWNGYTLVYPYHNGECNDYNIVRERIDNVINPNGYMPNVFKFFIDYDPSCVFYSDDISFPCRVGFSSLSRWYSEVMSNVYVIDTESCYGDTKLTICTFDDNKHVVFIGDFDSNIRDYFSNNRPYDFDIDNLIYGYNLSVSFEEIVSACDGDEGDYYFFIHPKYIGLDYNLQSSHEECAPVYSQSKFFGSTEKKTKSRKSEKRRRNRV